MKVLLEVDVPENTGFPFSEKDWNNRLAMQIRVHTINGTILGKDEVVFYCILADILDGAKILPQSSSKPMLDKETQHIVKNALIGASSFHITRHLAKWVQDNSIPYQEPEQEIPEN